MFQVNLICAFRHNFHLHAWLKLSTCLTDECTYVAYKLSVVHEILKVEVHAIAPVVFWIGRYVDAFGIGIRQTQLVVHGEPVLNAQYAEHRRRVKMTCYDVFGKPSWQRMWGWSLTIEHRVVIVLRTFVVLIPPLSQCRHVVA